MGKVNPLTAGAAGGGVTGFCFRNAGIATGLGGGSTMLAAGSGRCGGWDLGGLWGLGWKGTGGPGGLKDLGGGGGWNYIS